MKKNDPLSQTRNAEGEVLFSRYQQAAEDTLSLAEEGDAELSERLNSLTDTVKKIPSCCGSHEYRQCMAPRSQDILERIEILEKNREVRKSTVVEFSARVRASVNDRPSDHDDFASRYLNYLQDLEVLGSVNFLNLIRDLRESLEMNWPGQKCCKVCKPVSTDLSQDPVLNRLKLDDQGQTGVGGRVVNNASLVKAFDRFDESKKKKG
mgnify:FL=1